MGRDTLRTRGSRRGDALVSRVHVNETAPTHSSTRCNHPWLSQNWGLLALAAAAVVTMTFSAGSRTGPIRGCGDFTPVAHQTLFASFDGTAVSIHPPALSQRPWSRPGGGAGRVLQEEEGDDEGGAAKSIVDYETQLELFMCNPTLVVEGNDAYLVRAPQLKNALNRMHGLQQVDTEDINITIKTEPDGRDDAYYKCDENGMLQWHASIKYSAATAAALGTTPAIAAAHANDYVAYSSAEFKSLLSAYINDEYVNDASTVDLSADDIVVPTVGWVVTFPSEDVVVRTAAEGNANGIASGIQGDYGMWAWWVWLLFALLVLCCLLPLFYLLCRRRKNGEEDFGERLNTTRKGRQGEGLNKIYGPQWGITELDFEADYKTYNAPEMKQEYNGAGAGVEPTAYRASRPGQQSVSGEAWMQEAGKKSEWSAPSPSTNPSKAPGGGATGEVRRFDIDDEDGDRSVARLRSQHPQYSFDMHAGRGGGRPEETKLS